MSVIVDVHRKTEIVDLATAGTRTSTFTGSTVDISEFQGILKIILNSSAGAGGTTLAGKIQTGDLANGADATDVPGATFATVSTSSSLQAIAVDTRACKRFIRFVGTIAGGTGITFSVVAVGQKQVM